ncbi:hypothetical protein HDU96_009068 [Phlyctochytrium bullatum]|nr:hypothetical protein HDU96_009068 [Phlyctochytrium bullatum]
MFCCIPPHPHQLVHVVDQASCANWKCSLCSRRNHHHRFRCSTCDHDECDACVSKSISEVRLANLTGRTVIFSPAIYRFYCGHHTPYPDSCNRCTGVCGPIWGCACIECELLNTALGLPEFVHDPIHLDSTCSCDLFRATELPDTELSLHHPTPFNVYAGSTCSRNPEVRKRLVLPGRVSHPHPLTRMRRQAACCNICLVSPTTPVMRCGPCDWDECPPCFALSGSLAHNMTHEHPMIAGPMQRDGYAWVCDWTCAETFPREVSGFRCDPCGYDVCDTCVGEIAIKMAPPWMVVHPHLMVDGGTAAFRCSVCLRPFEAGGYVRCEVCEWRECRGCFYQTGSATATTESVDDEHVEENALMLVEAVGDEVPDPAVLAELLMVNEFSEDDTPEPPPGAMTAMLAEAVTVELPDPASPAELVPVTFMPWIGAAAPAAEPAKCVICMESFVADEELMAVSACLHRFHKGCISK